MCDIAVGEVNQLDVARGGGAWIVLGWHVRDLGGYRWWSGIFSLVQDATELYWQLIDVAVEDHDRATELLRIHPEVLEHHGYLSETPLHFLAVEDYGEAVKFLIERGACIDAKNEFDHTPLMECAALGNLQVLKMLLEAGANPNHSKDDGCTAMHMAAFANQTESLQLLAEFGGDIDRKDDVGFSARSILAERKRKPRQNR